MVISYVAVSKILCDNTAAWLLFLADLICITLATGRFVVSLLCAHTGSTAHLDLGRSKLSVVEQECSLRGSRLFENDRGILTLTLRGDFDASNLATGRLLASIRTTGFEGQIYQKEKKSLTSCSLVFELMFLTLTVLAADMMKVLLDFRWM